MSLVGRSIVVCGGEQHLAGAKFEYLPLEPYVLNTESLVWERPRVALGKGPAPRSWHTATVIDECLVFFGGRGEKKAIYNDLQCFDLAEVGPAPAARRPPAAARPRACACPGFAAELPTPVPSRRPRPVRSLLQPPRRVDVLGAARGERAAASCALLAHGDARAAQAARVRRVRAYRACAPVLPAAQRSVRLAWPSYAAPPPLPSRQAQWRRLALRPARARCGCLCLVAARRLGPAPAAAQPAHLLRARGLAGAVWRHELHIR